jgi:hypothetical protein
VELKSFKAVPAAIGPFGASVLSWEVTGPVGFRVQLGAQAVAKKDEQVVQPIGNSTFRLTAFAGRLSRQLGRVGVTVDSSACQTNSIVNPRSTIQAPIKTAIVSSGDLYFRGGSLPIVTFSPGRIRVQLRLGKSISGVPDPSVDIDSSFGLAINDGALEATAEQTSVNVRFLGLDVPFVDKDDARLKMHNAILGLVAQLNFLLAPPRGFRQRSVRVNAGNNGAGIIETTQCPFDLLKRFADISQVAVLE